MKTWILLLRGINVGGKNRLPMKELRAYMTSLQLYDVETYIQSGNAVFRAGEGVVAGLPTRLASTIEAHHGYSPQVLILSRAEWRVAMDSNPFPEAEAEPETLHLFFLASTPHEPDLDLLRASQLPSERFQLTDEVFYLHAPDGIGRSKLASKIGRSLGVEMTARNWRTVVKLWELANE